MKFRRCNTGPVRGFLALSVSLAVLASNCVFVFASFNKSNLHSSPAPAQTRTPGGLLSASAVVTEAGVRVEWTSSFDANNLGFNVYRVRAGKRTLLNREIIPGAIFGPVSLNGSVPGSYGWLDRNGTADSVYYVESVTQDRFATLHEPVAPLAGAGGLGRKHLPPPNQSVAPGVENQSYGSFETSYPAVTRSPARSHMLASVLEDQWSIAGQTALKIGIKKDGWYRVTQPEMVAQGFNPLVDIRNLQLFVDAQEVAISTSQSGGLFGPSDYIEFFGRGVNVPSTDVHTYYLIAGSDAGKRVRGELQIEAPPPPSPSPTPSPSPPPGPQPSPSPAADPGPGSKWSGWTVRKLTIASGHPVGLPFVPMIIWGPRTTETGSAGILPPLSAAGREQPPTNYSARQSPRLIAGSMPALPAHARLLPVPEVVKSSASAVRKKTSPRKSRRKLKPGTSKRSRNQRKYSHAVARVAAPAALAPAPSYFSNTVERKDRTVHFSGLINGEAENFFGQVISTNPASQTINTPNPAYSAPGSAKLEIKLQGVTSVLHQVNVQFNGVAIGSFSGFFGHGSQLKIFDVPLSSLQDGANTITFTPVAGGDVTLVDYARVTYPHTFKADSGSLKFSLLGTQTRQVDGFTSPNIQLIDYTDPLNVIVLRPEVAASGGGYALTVPSSTPASKNVRLFYATSTPSEPAATLTLNQPSQLNLSSNTADFLIITTSALAPALAPLVAAREAQGMNVDVVDVEDIFDEFGYGLHGPQAVKDFLARANDAWATKPKYVVFAGDASYDPRNYLGFGSFDLVPTKLVDATYNETASDDWLADFNGDGIADVPVGRLPARTTADVNLIVSKIINFTPVLPESAMLVADDPTGYYFNFEQANDQVQALLPPAMTVQRVNVRIDGPATAKTNVINGFNAGRALVNYTGHGNVDVWSGSAIFKSADATALTNVNRLSFVIVMDCLNGYFHSPGLLSMAEAFLGAPDGGAVAVFASSGLTLPDGQHDMSTVLYSQIFGAGAQPIALGDAIKIAKGATSDIDVRRTWIFVGDPSMKIR